LGWENGDGVVNEKEQVGKGGIKSSGHKPILYLIPSPKKGMGGGGEATVGWDAESGEGAFVSFLDSGGDRSRERGSL